MSDGQEETKRRDAGFVRSVLQSEAGLRVTAEDLASLADAFGAKPTLPLALPRGLASALLDSAEKSLAYLRTPADLEPAAVDEMRRDLLESLLRVAAYAPPRHGAVVRDWDRSDRGPGPA